MVVRLKARMPSAAITWWSWWMSCSVGWKTASGRHSSHSATSSSRMSWRCSGNVRTSKSWTVRFSGAIPSSAVASFTSRASVSGAKPSGSDRVAIENATYRTSAPDSTRRTIVPPAPNSPSSVCGASTRTRSHAPITARFISSLRAMTDLGAVLGALGAVAVLTAARRMTLLGSFVLVAGAEVVLAHAGGLHFSAKLVAPAVVAVAILAALAALLLRAFWLVTPLVLVAAPFRLPLDFGSSHRFYVAIAHGGQLGRLLPLYVVLAVAVLALVWDVVTGARL